MKKDLLLCAVDNDQVSVVLQAVLPAVVPVPPLGRNVVTARGKHQPVLLAMLGFCFTTPICRRTVSQRKTCGNARNRKLLIYLTNNTSSRHLKSMT